MDAGDFVGKAAIIARHEDRDARKLLVNVHIDGDMPDIGEPVAGDRRRSARRRTPRPVSGHPKLERNIGLALVPVRHAAPGTIGSTSMPRVWRSR